MNIYCTWHNATILARDVYVAHQPCSCKLVAQVLLHNFHCPFVSHIVGRHLFDLRCETSDTRNRTLDTPFCESVRVSFCHLNREGQSENRETYGCCTSLILAYPAVTRCIRSRSFLDVLTTKRAAAVIFYPALRHSLYKLSEASFPGVRESLLPKG